MKHPPAMDATPEALAKAILRARANDRMKDKPEPTASDPQEVPEAEREPDSGLPGTALEDEASPHEVEGEGVKLETPMSLEQFRSLPKEAQDQHFLDVFDGRKSNYETAFTASGSTRASIVSFTRATEAHLFREVLCRQGWER